MADDIQRWSEELARDPASKVFVPLADALRRCGQLDLARKVVTRGLERHPRDGDAHDVMARIWVDRGETQRAMEEWQIALQCSPRHPGALKGLAFAHFQDGRLADAERLLVDAVAADPDDASIRTAFVRVRAALGKSMSDSPPPPMEPAMVADAVSAPVTIEVPVDRWVDSASDPHDNAPEDGGSADVDAMPSAPLHIPASIDGASAAETSVAADAAPIAAALADAEGAAVSMDGVAAEIDVAVSDNGSMAAVAPPLSVTDEGAGGFNPTDGARQLFADFIGSGEQTALLLDGQGLVVAGTYFLADGRDVAADVGAALSGVSDEAHRAMRHLELGPWTSITFETDATTVAMGPLHAAGAPEDGIALVAAAQSVPLGFVRRLLQRVTERGAAWLGVGDANGDSAAGWGGGT